MMNVRGAVLVFVGTAFACGGKVEGELPGSTSSAAKAGENTGDNTGETQGSAGTNSARTPAPACTSRGSSSSGGSGQSGSLMCTTAEDFTCPTGLTTLSCTCTQNNGVWPPGTCSCNGQTFAFDCASPCQPGAAEYAKCGLPAPESDPRDSLGSSSSTSSSG